MKGYGHEEPAPIYIHYQCCAFPRVPQRKHLLASHNLPPLPLFFYPSITAASQPRPPRITPTSRCSPSNSRFPSQPAEREKPKERELTRRPNWAHAWEGEDLEAWRREPLQRGNTEPCLVQVFDTITSYLPHVDIQLFLGPRLKTNCWSGEFVKEMSVLSAEGLKLI